MVRSSMEVLYFTKHIEGYRLNGKPVPFGKVYQAWQDKKGTFSKELRRTILNYDERRLRMAEGNARNEDQRTEEL